MSVANAYTDGRCPDCEAVIPPDAKDGDECENCGHVFWSQEEWRAEYNSFMERF